ncbi:MAG: hypothetical protein R3B68_13905 [Phycisphaerales bacterium]
MVAAAVVLVARWLAIRPANGSVAPIGIPIRTAMAPSAVRVRVARRVRVSVCVRVPAVGVHMDVASRPVRRSFIGAVDRPQPPAERRGEEHQAHDGKGRPHRSSHSPVAIHSIGDPFWMLDARRPTQTATPRDALTPWFDADRSPVRADHENTLLDPEPSVANTTRSNTGISPSEPTPGSAPPEGESP